MVFKRRTKRGWLRTIAEMIYPRGGWGRAFSYVSHRLRRLPDAPHKIARGIGAGVFVSFTPLFGFHFILATLIALAVRGNVLAAILATFFGNPLTLPIIATMNLELGTWLIGSDKHFEIRDTVGAFADATVELWQNAEAIFTPEVAHWDGLIGFFHTVFLPYLVGGLLPGVITAVAFYFVTSPVIAAYQKHRRKTFYKKWEKARETTEVQKAKNEAKAKTPDDSEDAA